jgi:DNA-binding CsgD family transcriptional regulator
MINLNLDPYDPSVRDSSLYGKPLTEREKEVLRIIVSDNGLYSDQQIMEHLGIARSTLRNHIQSIFGKLNIDSSNELIINYVYGHVPVEVLEKK